MSEEIKGTPDLSRIISVIMENPSLIEEISALASKSSEPTQEATVEEAPAMTEPRAVDIHSRRDQLLSAMKPYLSSERQKAIDSMITFAEILDAVRRK